MDLKIKYFESIKNKITSKEFDFFTNYTSFSVMQDLLDALSRRSGQHDSFFIENIKELRNSYLYKIQMDERGITG